MTGVATLKDPRQSAIAGTVSRSSSLSPSPPPLSFTRLHVSSATRLPSLLPLTAGLDDTRVPHRAVNHGRWEAERPICPAAPKTKIANPKKRRPSYLHRDFRESFLPRWACGTGWRGARWTITPISLPGSSDRRKLAGFNGHSVFNHPNQFALSNRSWSRENRINTVKTDCFHAVVAVSNMRMRNHVFSYLGNSPRYDTLRWWCKYTSGRDISCLRLIT